jgi:valyl-tRNA synthetase
MEAEPRLLATQDIVTRFWAQQGFYVERRFGWDTHGLPVEFEIDKALGISVCGRQQSEYYDVGSVFMWNVDGLAGQGGCDEAGYRQV